MYVRLYLFVLKLLLLLLFNAILMVDGGLLEVALLRSLITVGLGLITGKWRKDLYRIKSTDSESGKYK